MFGADIFQGIISKLRRLKQSENKNYCCPVCGIKSDDPHEIFHHISEVHVMEKPIEVLNVSNDCDDELQKTYTDLVHTYKTSDRIMKAIADLQNISVSKKVLLGYVLGRNILLQENAGRVTTAYLNPVFPKDNQNL